MVKTDFFEASGGGVLVLVARYTMGCTARAAHTVGATGRARDRCPAVCPRRII